MLFLQDGRQIPEVLLLNHKEFRAMGRIKTITGQDWLTLYRIIMGPRTVRKGLCFWCREKFHPLHKCAERLLRLVILGDDDALKRVAIMGLGAVMTAIGRN